MSKHDFFQKNICLFIHLHNFFLNFTFHHELLDRLSLLKPHFVNNLGCNKLDADSTVSSLLILERHLSIQLISSHRSMTANVLGQNILTLLMTSGR